MTEKEIKDQYKQLHDDLTRIFYHQTPGQLSQEDFNLQHGLIWSTMEAELIAAGYKTAPEPSISIKDELQAIKDRLKNLEKK